MPIHVLSELLAAQIAAGEVIERPASVVKELIENAIDAGASDIRVEVRDGGKRLIRVADNGSGIRADEVELAFGHHATSKLASADDLFAIRTLGFRGEALPSIAAVAHVTMLTRLADEAVGTELRLSAGRIVSRKAHAAPTGTLVSVENLFHNLPARLKFMKSTSTESGHIHELVSRYALAYPSIRFSLLAENRLAFQSAGNGVMADVLVAVYGVETAKQMLEVQSPESEVQSQTRDMGRGTSDICVSGYTSAPTLHRANRSHMVLFVNGRAVQDRNLTFAVREAYHTLLPVGRYPLCILKIDLPLEQVDVNVHPAKAEVRFRDAHAVFSVVQRAVRRTLLAHQAAPSITIQTEWPTSSEGHTPGQLGMEIQRTAPAPSLTPNVQPPASNLQSPITNHPTLIQPATHPTSQPTNQPTLKPSDKLPMLRVLGQVARTYIVAEGPEGIFLIDQHAAHERVLYEKFKRERMQQGLNAQQLLEPVTVELRPQQAARLDEQMSLLQAAGFQIEPFGGSTYLLRAVPSIMSEGDPRHALALILDELADERELRGETVEPMRDQREAMLIASVCKQAAIKAGRALSLPEMQELVQQLEQSESPRTCPHGRPTVIRLGLDQLAREFRRA